MSLVRPLRVELRRAGRQHSRHETSDRLYPHRAGRPAVASVEFDEDPECRFSGTDGERELERAVVADAAAQREYVAQAPPAGGILLRARRHGPDPDRRRDGDGAEARRRARGAGAVAPGLQ